MSYAVRRRDGVYELIVSDEPWYVRALTMSPELVETELNAGLWLLVVFSIWSAPVRKSVSAAIECSKAYSGDFQLGLCAFDDPSEVERWWPQHPAIGSQEPSVLVTKSPNEVSINIIGENTSIPLWLVLREREKVYDDAGARSVDELKNLMEQFVRSK